MWASKTKTAIKREGNCQPNNQRWRSKCQAADRIAEQLAEVPANELAIGSYRASKHFDEPGCSTSNHNRPDRNEPVNPPRRFLVLGSTHDATARAGSLE